MPVCGCAPTEYRSDKMTRQTERGASPRSRIVGITVYWPGLAAAVASHRGPEEPDWRNHEITMLRASDHRELTCARWREDGLSDTAADRRWPRMALSHANSRRAQRRRSMLLRWERNEAAQRIVLVSTRASRACSCCCARVRAGTGACAGNHPVSIR